MMFKVGDWITISKGKAWKATAFDVAHLELDNDVELWKPKEGEWCWFWDVGVTIPLLDKFVLKQGDICPYFTKTTCFDNCEPFIGELPSFLKDN